MPDVPRDPRQLARDILSGKVRIEDLARERQMRGGMAPPGGAGPRMPQKIPLPRPVPPPVQRVPVQRVPVRQPQRPMPQQRMPQPQRPMPPQQRPLPQQAQRPIAVPAQRQAPRPQYTVPPPQPVAVVAEPLSEPAQVTRAVRRPTRLSELVKSKHALRQGILLAEVLGKPVALREERN